MLAIDKEHKFINFNKIDKLKTKYFLESTDINFVDKFTISIHFSEIKNTLYINLMFRFKYETLMFHITPLEFIELKEYDNEEAKRLVWENLDLFFNKNFSFKEYIYQKRWKEYIEEKYL